MGDAASVGLRKAAGRKRARWLLLALPLAIVAGVLLALASPTGVSGPFKAPAGPPDTLRGTRMAVPKTPQLLKAAYLERAVAARNARDTLAAVYVTRYNITHTLARSIVDAAMEAGIDPELAFRLIRVESVFDPEAENPGGALGLCQLMPGTARDLDPEVDTKEELLEPRTNMRLGFKNLRDMILRYEGDVRLGVIAYNRGEIAVDRALKRGRDPENGYSEHVLGPRAHGGKPYRGKGLLEPRAPSAAAR
ncbi:MAG TPA: transglycosylase SLT domain-containing protein [Longimicrobium sp.]